MTVNPFSALVYGAIAALGAGLWAGGLALAALWGWELAGLALVVGYMALIAFAGCFYRYEVLLGEADKREGTAERTDYVALRNTLQSGGGAVRIYTDWLTRFLRAVDRFFGDENVATHGRAARLFGLLREPAALWTAPSYDRCLLLALLYPIGMIFLIWGISGHVGPAEAALGLPTDIDGWRRGITFAFLALTASATRRGAVTSGLSSIGWYAVALIGAFLGVFMLLDAFAFAFAIIASFIIARIFAFAASDAGAVSGGRVISGAVVVIAMFILAISGNVSDAVPKFLSGFVTGIVAVFVFVVVVGAGDLINIRSKMRGRQRVILLLFTLMMTATSLAGSYFLSSEAGWRISGPLLLFLVLLTLINAPFDWLSLGLTRGLLRLGIERGGWWPYLLALADAVAAVAVIAVLSCAMVIGIQTFDYLAMLGGGKPVLPLREVFDGIGANPDAPEYWWIYALLLSTMIPSLINLAIGGTALFRGIPGLGSRLLRLMPDGDTVPTYNRPVLALALTGQWALGIVLGVAAQFILAWFIVGRFLPWIGFGLLDLARGIEVFNLPLRVHQLF